MVNQMCWFEVFSRRSWYQPSDGCLGSAARSTYRSPCTGLMYIGKLPFSIQLQLLKPCFFFWMHIIYIIYIYMYVHTYCICGAENTCAYLQALKNHDMGQTLRPGCVRKGCGCWGYSWLWQSWRFHPFFVLCLAEQFEEVLRLWRLVGEL